MVPLCQSPEPSLEQTAPLQQSDPVVVVDVSKGYSSVNKLSLLPDDVRTAANLEGDTVPAGQQELLLEQYKKERADYELKQLQKMEELRTERGGGPSQTSTSVETGPGYEDVELVSTGAHTAGAVVHHSASDTYASPADAVANTPCMVGMAKRSPKKLSIGTGVLTTGENYTPVFNTLPRGHVETVPPAQAQGRTTRTLSDSSPAVRSPKKANAAYENSPWPSPSSDEVGGATGEIGDKQEANRLSKRGSVKEVVEFDPKKQRKFRVTSDAAKKKVDIEQTDSSQSSPENSQGDSAAIARMPIIPFSIRKEEQAQLSYALVNMDDKQRFRLEVNAMKSEGSGVPEHYRVPIASS